MIGIIILNYINWKDTMECIESIFDTTKQAAFHVYVVDNASPVIIPDKYIQFFKEDHRVTFIQNIKNMGYSGGNNIGIRKALADGCEAIVISNSDIVFHENSIDNMASYLGQYDTDDLGILGPAIYNRNKMLQKSVICMKTGLKEKYIARTRLSSVFQKHSGAYFGDKRDFNTIFPAYAVSGCCFLITRKCALDITPLDETLFLFQEELVLGIVMENKGYKTLYYPLSTVTHAHGESTSHAKAFSFICFVQSELYYCKKYLHANLLHIFPLYLIRTASYLLRCFYIKDFRASVKSYFRKTAAGLIKKY